MNEGIGIDIVDINKFKKIIYSSKPNFYEKLFLKSEIDYCLRFKILLKDLQENLQLKRL